MLIQKQKPQKTNENKIALTSHPMFLLVQNLIKYLHMTWQELLYFIALPDDLFLFLGNTTQQMLTVVL